MILESTLDPGINPKFLESTLEITFEPTLEITFEPTLEITFEPTLEITFEPTLEITFESTLNSWNQPLKLLLNQPFAWNQPLIFFGVNP